MHDKISELLNLFKLQHQIVEIVFRNNEVSICVEGDFDDFITKLGFDGRRYLSGHPDKNCHTVNISHNDVRYFTVENQRDKYTRMQQDGHKWCYDCINYQKGPYFCGYSEVSCKIHGSLDVDQKERHPDKTANTCKDYVQKEGERWWTKYYKE